ncbi:hypothetical protein [Kocuria arenosa]
MAEWEGFDHEKPEDIANATSVSMTIDIAKLVDGLVTCRWDKL